MKYLLLLTVLLSSGAFTSVFDATKRLADQGNADAQNAIGYMYDIGEGIAENDAEAIKWFRKAADQGHAKAQYNLGSMYAMAKVFQGTMLKPALWPIRITTGLFASPGTWPVLLDHYTMIYEED